MKKKSLLFLLPAAALMLAACDGTGTDSTSSGGDNPNSSTSNTTSSGTTSSTSHKETYRIDIQTSGGISITADKTEAAAGETVTLTITLSDGYSLSSLSVNGTPIAFEASGTTFTVTFQMPDFDAHITYTLAILNANVSIGGDLVAVMEESDGVYVARNVVAESTSNIYVAVKGVNGGYSYFAYNEIYREKCFGDITYSDIDFSEASLPSAAPETQQRDSLIEVGGNAAYDIYFNPSTSKIWIQRVDVLNLPSNPEQFESLFDGSVKSDPTNYPANVNQVTFSDNLTGNDYSWKLYANDTSLATVKNEDRGTTTYVYKTIKDGVYTIVDNYIEGVTYTNPYSDGWSNPYVDDSASTDTYAYSGKYNIVEEVESGKRDHQISAKDAEFEVSHYSHDMNAIDRMQWESYRSSFTLEDDLCDAGRVVTSVENEDGSFTTTIKSYKTYDPIGSPSIYARMTEQTHIEYEVVTTFTKAGAPLEGSYREVKYNNNEYNFDDGEFYPGMQQNGGKLVKRFNYTYSYGEAEEGVPTFDSAPYFATEVSAHLEDEDGNDVTSTPVNGGWSTEDDTPSFVIEATGENADTALDAWQYGITGTSPEGIFVPDKWTEGVYQASLTQTGTATLTLGNFVDNNNAGSVTLTVENALVHNFYLTAVVPYQDDWHLTSADTAQLYGGTSWTAGLHTSGEDNANFHNISATTSDPDALSVTINPDDRTITFTAAPTTTQKTVTVTVTSTDYDPSWGTGDEFVITILPGNGIIQTEDITGTWKVELNEDVYDFNPDDPTTFTFNEDGTGTLVMNDPEWVATYSFSWDYDDNLNALNIENIKKVSGTAPDFQYYSMTVAIEAIQDLEGGNNLYKLGFIFYGESQSSSDWTSSMTDILGVYATDEEGYLDPNYSEYVFFVNTALVD